MSSVTVTGSNNTSNLVISSTDSSIVLNDTESVDDVDASNNPTNDAAISDLTDEVAALQAINTEQNATLASLTTSVSTLTTSVSTIPALTTSVSTIPAVSNKVNDLIVNQFDYRVASQLQYEWNHYTYFTNRINELSNNTLTDASISAITESMKSFYNGPVDNNYTKIMFLYFGDASTNEVAFSMESDFSANFIKVGRSNVWVNYMRFYRSKTFAYAFTINNNTLKNTLDPYNTRISEGGDTNMYVSVFLNNYSPKEFQVIREDFGNDFSSNLILPTHNNDVDLSGQVRDAQARVIKTWNLDISAAKTDILIITDSEQYTDFRSNMDRDLAFNPDNFTYAADTCANIIGLPARSPIGSYQDVIVYLQKTGKINTNFIVIGIPSFINGLDWNKRTYDVWSRIGNIARNPPNILNPKYEKYIMEDVVGAQITALGTKFNRAYLTGGSTFGTAGLLLMNNYKHIIKGGYFTSPADFRFREVDPNKTLISQLSGNILADFKNFSQGIITGNPNKFTDLTSDHRIFTTVVSYETEPTVSTITVRTLIDAMRMLMNKTNASVQTRVVEGSHKSGNVSLYFPEAMEYIYKPIV